MKVKQWSLSLSMTLYNQLMSQVLTKYVSLCLCHTGPGSDSWPSGIPFFNTKLGQKFGDPKTSKFQMDFRQLRNLIANNSEISSIGKLVANYGHSCTCKPNLVNFGPQMAKNGTIVLTHPKSTFSNAHIWEVRGRCCQKF